MTLSDGFATTVDEFNVEVFAAPVSVIEAQNKMIANTGPPVFKCSLEDLLVNATTTLRYELPEIADPDGDQFTCTVML